MVTILKIVPVIIEASEDNLSLAVIEKIAQALGVTSDELLK
jgi:transcriptional regulator with XRE-family HTH domain